MGGLMTGGDAVNGHMPLGAAAWGSPAAMVCDAVRSLQANGIDQAQLGRVGDVARIVNEDFGVCGKVRFNPLREGHLFLQGPKTCGLIGSPAERDRVGGPSDRGAEQNSEEPFLALIQEMTPGT